MGRRFAPEELINRSGKIRASQGSLAGSAPPPLAPASNHSEQAKERQIRKLGASLQNCGACEKRAGVGRGAREL